MDVNQTYCGDRFTVYTNIESLCCAPETNIMLYVNYTSIKKGKEKKKSATESDTITSRISTYLPTYLST